MNWLLIIVLMIFFVSILVGLVEGAVKKVVSLCTTLLTFVIVFFAAPYVTKAVADFTPLDDVIEEQVSGTILDMAMSQITGEGEGEGGSTSEGVRKALSAAGIDENTLEQYGITVDDIVSGNISKEELAKYGISGNVLDGVLSGKQEAQETQETVEGVEIPREMQMKAIQNADIPDVFKNLLAVNNNSEIYKQLGVKNFAQYVGSYLARLTIDIVSFLCTFLVVTIILRAVIFSLDVIAELPGLGVLNHLAGGVLGMIGALIIVWLLFLGITLLFTTAFGGVMFQMIEDSSFLQMLYDYNPVLKVATLFR